MLLHTTNHCFYFSESAPTLQPCPCLPCCLPAARSRPVYSLFALGEHVMFQPVYTNPPSSATLSVRHHTDNVFDTVHISDFVTMGCGCYVRMKKVKFADAREHDQWKLIFG